MVFYKMRILIPWALIRRGSFAQVFFLEALFPGATVQRRHPLAGGVAFFAVFSRIYGALSAGGVSGGFPRLGADSEAAGKVHPYRFRNPGEHLRPGAALAGQ